MTGIEYLAQHAISEEFAKSIGITWDDDYLNIPVKDDKSEWVKHRNLNHDPDEEGSQKYKNDAGSHATIYNLTKFKDVKTLILTEGEIDCIKLTQEGMAAVSVTSGAGTFDKKFAKKLEKYKLYVCYDNDRAGQEGIEKVLEFLPNAKIVPLPKGAKDICEFFSMGFTKADFQAIKTQTYEEWLIANEPEEFKFLEGQELVKRAIPKEEWLIDRVLPVEGFTFFVGAEATGKSFLTLTLANSVTTGMPWLSKFDVKIKTNVLFIDKENTKRRTQSRMRGLKINGENMYWIEYPQYFDLTDPKETDGFSRFVKAVARKVKTYNIGLIFIDSFTDVMVGNENAAADTQQFFDGFRQLFPGVSVCVLHHENKPTQGTARSSSQRTRGSTNITAQIVVGFRTEASVKEKGIFTLEQIKVGDAEKLNKFKMKMVVSPDPEDPEKTLVTGLSYEGEFSDAVAAVDYAVDFIMEYLADNPESSRQQIIDAGAGVAITEASVKRGLEVLKDKKLMNSKEDKTNKRKKLFYLTSDEDVINPLELFNGNAL